MPKMRSLKSKTWRYAKQNIEPGGVFDAQDKHVLVLTHARIAELMDAQETKAQAEAPKAKAHAPRSAGSNQATKAKPNQKNLTEMTIPELRQFAKAMGIVIEAGARKADIVDLLRRQRYGRRDMRAAD